jgi:flagellar hook-length control protein FliK
MKLVVDNPMQVPTKSANKARGASPFLIAKSTGEGGAKNSAVRDFQRFLEARVSARAESIDMNGSESKELQEQPPVDWVERSHPDAMSFGNLFDDLERKYERDLNEEVPFELQNSEGILAQEAKIIDARMLFASQRHGQQYSGLSTEMTPDSNSPSAGMTLPANAGMHAGAAAHSAAKGTTEDEKSSGAGYQRWHVGQGPGTETVTPREFVRIEKQQPAANFPTENAESHDNPMASKTGAGQGKSAETNSSPEVSAMRAEGLSTLATTPSPMHQLVERVTKMLPDQNMEIRHLADGLKTIRFALRPESLGDVSVILRVRDSRVDLAIRPQRGETAQYLENARDDLLQSLKLTGVELGIVEISAVDTTTGQDVRQDKPGTGQGGGHTSQFPSPQGGNPFHGGDRENQWGAPEASAARKGKRDESETPEMDGPDTGRGIIL